MNTIRHQYDSNGRHRLVQLDFVGFLKEAGEWSGYTHHATYTAEDRTFIAVTNYFEGTSLIPNQIYEVRKIEERLDGGSE